MSLHSVTACVRLLGRDVDASLERTFTMPAIPEIGDVLHVGSHSFAVGSKHWTWDAQAQRRWSVKVHVRLLIERGNFTPSLVEELVAQGWTELG